MSSNNSVALGACSSQNGSVIAGWYGKIPSLGDFISRRLPAVFIDSWDSWLQQSLIASRAQLGERWLKLYLTGPILRFALMPQVCGATSIWAGVIMPSVDKVGRYFPLTIALGMEARPGMMLTVFSAQTWYAALERIALASLNLDALPDDLDRNLADNPFPALDSCYPRRDAQELATWWRGGGNMPCTLTLPTESALPDLFDTTAEFLLTCTAPGKSFWWSVSSEAGPTQLHCFTGLPPENYFSRMLEANSPAEDSGGSRSDC